METDNPLGQVVYSKVGRDSDNYYVIIDVLNDDYVYIVDGRLRKIEKPKKKRCKHLIFTGIFSEEIRASILNGKNISNSKIKKILDTIANKEV
ncbi:KOW domain-containing RNA-binding protein [Hathewaya histolytica]|uniref:50S ribosomal protein L14 n=1 Tax=Hathewaya histolytica TaxID=1498 RepID=A0A4U9RRQ3_HATHI|nr:KOW domain-containing RNA-binding protein [Hathewaya histolytica]VTQ94972.1 50S ribosomal protein L14 [Hathewaya histolytica]